MRATTGRLPFDSNTSHRLVRVEPLDNSLRNACTELLSDRIAEHVFRRIRLVTSALLSETLVQYLADPEPYSKAFLVCPNNSKNDWNFDMGAEKDRLGAGSGGGESVKAWLRPYMQEILYFYQSYLSERCYKVTMDDLGWCFVNYP